MRSHFFYWLLLLSLAWGCSLRLAPQMVTPSPLPVQGTLMILSSPVVQEETPGTQVPSQVPAATSPSPLVLPPTEVPTIIPQPTQALPPPDLGVVYIKDDNVFVWRPGSGPLQLTVFGGVKAVYPSPNGTEVAVLRQAGEFQNELWVVHMDGSGGRRLVSRADLDALEPETRRPETVAINPYQAAWAPGSSLLAFNTVQVMEGPGGASPKDLRLVDTSAVSPTITTVLPNGQGGMFYYSPDGTQVAVVTPQSISLVNADGSRLRSPVFLFDQVNTYSEYSYHPEPVWSADSSELWVVVPPVDAFSEPRLPTEIWKISAGEKPEIALVSKVQAAPFFGSPVALAPGLSRLAYLTETGTPLENRSELHLANLDGSQDTLYHTAALLQFDSWAPGDGHFVFRFDEDQKPYLGQVGGEFLPLPGINGSAADGVSGVQWVNSDFYLFTLTDSLSAQWELRLGSLDGTSEVIDHGSGQVPAYEAVW